MRYSELSGKEIVCIDEGIRLGVVDRTDLIIDLRTGEVQSIVIPYGSRWFRPKLIVCLLYTSHHVRACGDLG